MLISVLIVSIFNFSTLGYYHSINMLKQLLNSINDRVLIIYILFLFCGLIPTKINTAQFHDMKFEYLTVDKGLSNNRIHCIFRDSKGYLWIGTEEGLNRYDGQKITIFKYSAAQNNTLSGNTVMCVFEDHTHNIWIGTTKGLNVFDRKKETFKRYLNGSANSISNNSVTSIIEDNGGDLWFSTDNGLNKWNRKNDDFSRFFVPAQENKDIANKIVRIYMDTKNNLWLTTHHSQIWKFNTETLQFINFSVPSVLTDNNTIRDVIVDNSGMVWIGTQKSGLFSFDPVDNRIQQYSLTGNGKGTNGKNILYLMLSENRYLYISVENGGINRLDLHTNNFEYCTKNEDSSNGLNSNEFWTLYKDYEGILYAGTGVAGININNPQKERFTLYQHNPQNKNSLIFNVIFKFYEDSYGYIWIGTDGGGLSVFDPVKKTFQNYQYNPEDSNTISGNSVLAITEDKNHDIWVGTWGAGLNRFDRKTRIFHHFTPDMNDMHAISSQDIWDLFTDAKGNIWIDCAFMGIDLFDIKKGVVKRFRPNNTITGTNVSAHTHRIIRQSNGEIGFATDKGYYVLDETNDNIHKVEKLENYNLHDVYLDKNGNYWLATDEKCLVVVMRNGLVERYNDNNGLPSGYISSILEDNQGKIWILSNSGVSEYLDQTKTFRHFSIPDGLQGLQFSRFARLKAQDGSIYVGGCNGFNVFRSDQIKLNTYIRALSSK